MRTLSIIGRLGKDPETREAGSTTVTRANVAVDAGKDKTIWISASIWGKRGQTFEQYHRKGASVALSGDLSTTEKDGRTYLNLDNASWSFVPKAKQESAPEPYDAGDYVPPAGGQDDIPF